MDSNILSAIIGGAIVLITFIIAQLLSRKQDLRKNDFEKLDEIIESINQFETELQKDFVTIFDIGHKNNDIPNPAFALNRLNVLVKIYHPDLAQSVDEMIKEANNYFSKKVKIINITMKPKGDNKDVLKRHGDELVNIFDNVINKTKDFTKSLIDYGQAEMKKR